MGPRSRFYPRVYFCSAFGGPNAGFIIWFTCTLPSWPLLCHRRLFSSVPSDCHTKDVQRRIGPSFWHVAQLPLSGKDFSVTPSVAHLIGLYYAKRKKKKPFLH